MIDCLERLVLRAISMNSLLIKKKKEVNTFYSEIEIVFEEIEIKFYKIAK